MQSIVSMPGDEEEDVGGESVKDKAMEEEGSRLSGASHAPPSELL